MKTTHYKQSAILLIASFCLFLMTNVSAQQLSKEQIKIAYIYNFLKHITWPEEDKKQQFVLAVYQDKAFQNSLAKAFQNKKVKGKDIKVLAVKNITKAKVADILYLPNRFNHQLAQLSSQIRSSQTLLVTDNSQDKHNAMLNLVDKGNGNAISFEMNKSNIVYEQLKTSAQLLLLGGTELDIAYLYRETENAMQLTRERESTLNAELALQQAKITTTNKKLNKLNTDLQQSAKEITQQRATMAQQRTALNKQQLELQKKEQELEHILQQLSEANNNYSVQTKAINEKKQQVAAKEQENQQMADLIAKNKYILEQQQQNITDQKQELDIQHSELATQKETIVQQKTTITITSVLILLVALALFLVIGLFWKNKKTTRKLSITLAHLEETQNQLIQSEKMASLGKLIAGVAHEINTPLGIAVTSTSLIQENIADIAKKLNDRTLNQRQLQSFIDIVSESSRISNKGLERVIELMHNFKEVAADQIIEEVRDINLADYINEIMSTLANELKKKRVNYLYKGEENVHINTIPGALAQVITNLVNNSIRHGFDTDNNSEDNQNTITISIEKNKLDEVSLIYRDNGRGMDDKTLSQVFDPFFTTKRNKGGTGLGMNIVFNIIEQKLAGHIEIQSAPNEGVECSITLPILINVDNNKQAQ